MAKVVNISKTFTRIELIGVKKDGKAHQYNEVVAANHIMIALLGAGIPVVGVMGVVAVEWGKLTVTHDDGLDGDEWTYSWTGEEVPKHYRSRMQTAGYRNRLDKPLAAQIAADDEL
jgi:hypothetical protein